MAIKKKDNVWQEDLYRLWIEYLKRSDDYKEFCEWVAKKRKNKKLPPPDKFRRDPKTGSPKEISNYIVFGPVHESRWTFKEWWVDHKKKLTYRQGNSIPRAVEDYRESIGSKIDSCLEDFKEQKRREPTLQEFKDYFLKCLNAETYFSFLRIDNSENKEVIEAEFKKLLKELKKDPRIKGLELNRKRRYLPSINYIRMDELKRHLRIYDKWTEGSRINEIIKTDEYYKGRKEKHDVARRLVYMDIAKAKRVIRNVEFGIFPGKYGGVKVRIK